MSLGKLSGGALTRRAAPAMEDGQRGFKRQDAADSLVFNLVSVKCIDETDGFLGSEAGSDEITLTGALVDAGGATFSIPAFDCGDFASDGVVRNYQPPHKLGALDFRSGAGWPKTFNMVLSLIEVDNGNLPALITKLYNELRAKIGPAVTKLAKPLGDTIAEAISAAIQAALDKIFKFFKDIWEDDVFGAVNLNFSFASADDRFDGQSSTPPQFVDFTGHGGKYRVWYTASLALAADVAIANKAVFYEHANYAGRSLTLGLGRHDLAAIQALGNDVISSLKVGPGLRVIGYQHAGFTGVARIYTGQVSGLGDMNDQISSLVIEPLTVTLFQHANYGGASQSLGLGRFDVARLAVGNDQVSSVLVPPGFKVTLFEKAGFTGRKKVIQGDQTYVGDDFNDIVSSVIVELA